MKDGFTGPRPEIELVTSLDASAPDLARSQRDQLMREAAGNPLALIELPPERDAPMPGLLPLTKRLEHAFAARVSELPDYTRLLLLVTVRSAPMTSRPLQQQLSLRHNVPGTVYVLHFEPAYKHAGHYVGWTEGDVCERIAVHLQGCGSPLVRAAVAAGVDVQLAATYEGRATWSGG
jgi:hypothetical protein